MDKMVEPLKVTVTTKVKANSVKQEFEKQDELKRSAMRALAALMVIPGADKHPQLNEFLSQASDCGAWYQSTKCYYSNWYLGVSQALFFNTTWEGGRGQVLRDVEFFS